MPNSRKKKNKSKKKTKDARHRRRLNDQCDNNQTSNSNSSDEEQDASEALEQFRIHPDLHMSNLLKEVLTYPLEYYLVPTARARPMQLARSTAHYNVVEDKSTGDIQVQPCKTSKQIKTKTDPVEPSLKVASNEPSTSSQISGRPCIHKLLDPATRKKSKEVAKLLTEFLDLHVVVNPLPPEDPEHTGDRFSERTEADELIAELERIGTGNCNCADDAELAKSKKIERDQVSPNTGDNKECELADDSKHVPHSRICDNAVEPAGFDGAELSCKNPDDNCISPNLPNWQDDWVDEYISIEECSETDTITLANQTDNNDKQEYDQLAYVNNQDTQGVSTSDAVLNLHSDSQQVQEVDQRNHKIECCINNDDTQGVSTSVLNLNTFSQQVQELDQRIEKEGLLNADEHLDSYSQLVKQLEDWVINDTSFEERLAAENTMKEIQQRGTNHENEYYRLNNEGTQGADAVLNVDSVPQQVEELDWVVEDISFEECLEADDTVPSAQQQKTNYKKEYYPLGFLASEGESTSDAVLDTFSQDVQKPESNHRKEGLINNQDTQTGSTSDAVLNLEVSSQNVLELPPEGNHEKKYKPLGFLDDEDTQGGSSSHAVMDLDSYSSEYDPLEYCRQVCQAVRGDTEPLIGKDDLLCDSAQDMNDIPYDPSEELDEFFFSIDQATNLLDGVLNILTSGPFRRLMYDLSDDDSSSNEMATDADISNEVATGSFFTVTDVPLVEKTIPKKGTIDIAPAKLNFNTDEKSSGSVDAKKSEKEHILKIDTAKLNKPKLKGDEKTHDFNSNGKPAGSVHANKPDREHIPKKDTADIAPAKLTLNQAERIQDFNANEISSVPCLVPIQKRDNEHKPKRERADSAQVTPEFNSKRKSHRSCLCDMPRKERKPKKVGSNLPPHDPSTPGTSAQANQIERYYNLAIQLYHSKMNQNTLEEEIVACGHSEMLHSAIELGEALERKDRKKLEEIKMKEKAREEKEEKQRQEKEAAKKSNQNPNWKGKGKGKNRKNR